ncbi:SPARC 1 [Solea senegalensis]|uniref:SPARC 1 n=1 Tax=Solea senegalensis TaxID=28829 RepID=A0AAV6Q8Z2_SOLSE|nr:SPARC-like protein 1 [Solea senegalensis]KAG7486118.1 SPARC 1 [Solea senegalensis]
MKACLVFTCLLTATFVLSIESKHHGKHHVLHKNSHKIKEKEVMTEEADQPQVPKNKDQDDGQLNSERNADTNKEDREFQATDDRDTNIAVLLNEEELIDLLKKGATEEEVERKELEVDKDKDPPAEVVEISQEEEAEGEEKKEDGKLETGEVVTIKREVKEDSMKDEVHGEVENMSKKNKKEESVSKMADRDELVTLLDETEGSTESDLPVNLDYAADSGIIQPLQQISAKTKPHANYAQPSSKDVTEKEQLAVDEDYEHDMQNTEAAISEEVSDLDKLQVLKNAQDLQAKAKEITEDVKPQEKKRSRELDSGSRVAGKEEEERSKDDDVSHTKKKTRKQKKNQRARKHTPQSEEAQTELSQRDRQESEISSSSDNRVHKAKRRGAGKWSPLVGMNPVQIRATMDLYPGSRPSLSRGVHRPDAAAGPCDSFRCKRGKTCKLDADNKPGCVCQEPSQCPPSVNEFDHVCGTDNKTYHTSCELFATKCNLEGTKRGPKLHLDYTGPCKLIPSCVDTELVQFPLRMRDWLKNVLLQLYELDTTSPGFLTPKQHFRVRKLFESERRLHAGDHSVELLAQDFEKNYNLYIYPVHWQFAQLDQHPSDRFLSHSELAPLRVPLVPMEHCTSRFFQECDTDKDKQVSFEEWISCFGIRNEDMDVNLIF